MKTKKTKQVGIMYKYYFFLFLISILFNHLEMVFTPNLMQKNINF